MDDLNVYCKGLMVSTCHYKNLIPIALMRYGFTKGDLTILLFSMEACLKLTECK